MAIEPAVNQTVFVDTFTDGLLGPEVTMLGPVANGGHIVWNSTPGCWGPMITPSIRGGHEVSRPVAVADAEVGDAIAIRIKDIEVTSLATASGNDQPMEGRFNGDPYCAPVCPGCGAEWPETRIDGIGEESIRCANCGADATPFTFTNGYTIAFDELRGVGVTVPRDAAESFAREAPRFAALPDNSVQNPILTFAPHDIVALATRLRPFLGQIGTSPSTTIPDSHNAGDFGSFLIGAPHRYALTPQELQTPKTDGHTLRRVGHGHAPGGGGQGPRHRRAGAVPARGGPAVPGQAALGGGEDASSRARSPVRNRRTGGIDPSQS